MMYGKKASGKAMPKASKMKKQPEPPKKTYTAKDSAEAVGIAARMKKDVKKFKEGDIGSGFRLNERIDSLSKNPYTPTMLKRDMEKGSSKEKGMKSTKSTPTKSMTKPMAKAMAAKKMAAKKK
jgi:hypothetical protein